MSQELAADHPGPRLSFDRRLGFEYAQRRNKYGRLSMHVLTVVSSTWSRSVATYKKYEPVIARAWLWMLTIWMLVSSFAYVLFPNFLSDSLDRWILRVWLITGVISVFGLYFLKQILDNLETKQLFGTLLICMILVIAMSILVLYRIKPLYSVC